MNKYLWYCPDCKQNERIKGTILLKTDKPYLGNGEIKCHECKKIFSFWEITKANKIIIEKYLRFIENVINK